MAIFQVTNLDDAGAGSLRQAILDANSTAGADTIKFANSLSGGMIELSSGELSITESLTINGLGANLLSVNAGNQGFRVFNIDDGNNNNLIDVIIDGLTITGGNPSGDGGGIRSLENLTVQNSTVSGNTIVATTANVEDNLDGGGIYNRNGKLTVRNSTISDNRLQGEKKAGTFFGDDLDGGGIALWYGQLEVSNSNISGNSLATGVGDGGGIYAWKSDVMVSESTISGNTVDASGIAAGGGICIYYGNGTVTGSTISSNSIYVGESYNADGGGISIIGPNISLTVANSTISGNQAFQLDGNVGSNDGGGIYHRYASVTVTDSTISGNLATRGGGGIAGFRAMTTIKNSTISGNTASQGGGVFARSGSNNTTISNSTIADNSAAAGGGIYNRGTATVASTIIANNANNQDLGGTSGFSSKGNNLIGNGSGGHGFTNGVNGDLVGTANSPLDPLLGPLADNGGTTKTHALLAGSPAIDAGNNLDNLIYDQRGMGFVRVVNGVPDIGALEVQVLEADLTLSNTASATGISPGEKLTYTLTVSNDGIQTAENVVISDLLPDGVTLVSSSGCDEGPNGTLTCSVGDLAPGASQTLTIIASVKANARGTLLNRASVTADTLDPDPDNNSAEASSTIVFDNVLKGDALGPSRDNIIGTKGSDLIIGGIGSDSLTGKGGGDRFVYQSLQDGKDTIINFQVGLDSFDLSSLLASLGLLGIENPISAGIVGFIPRNSNTYLTFDRDGMGPGRATILALVRGTTATELNNLDNFVF